MMRVGLGSRLDIAALKQAGFDNRVIMLVVEQVSGYDLMPYLRADVSEVWLRKSPETKTKLTTFHSARIVYLESFLLSCKCASLYSSKKNTGT